MGAFDSVFTQTSTPSTVSSGNDFNKDVLGTKFEADQGIYDNFTNNAYGQATRLLDPQFDRMSKDFEQKAINRGFSPGTEAYNTAFDQNMRQQNDAYNQAAFGAMEYGANRLDADRSMSEAQRQFDAGTMEGGRQFDKSDLTNRYNTDSTRRTNMANIREGGRQFDAAQELRDVLGYEGIASGYRDDVYRDAVFNSQQDQQQFDNLFNMQSLVPGQQFIQPNSSSANAIDAANSRYDQGRNDSLYQGIGEAIGQIGSTWNSTPAQTTETPQPVGSLYDPNFTIDYTSNRY